MEVGIDIQEISAFKDFKKNERFYKNVFSNREIESCLKKKAYKSCFCAKFCIKEAIIKIFDAKISFKDIEILNSPSGKPYILIKSKIRKDLSLSLSHSKKVCVGVVIKV